MTVPSDDGSFKRSEIAEARWLMKYPQFEERPATIREFVTANYLNNERSVRPGVMQALIDIFGDDIDPDWISLKRRAVFTGGIGIGKTTFASIVLPYMVHWVFCLRDAYEYFDIMDGTRIAFMMMSTSEKQAKEVLFGDVKARVENSPWFRDRCPRDERYENQIRFAKNIWILPGGSEETAFEGYNILGGVLDEGDSHKKTQRKDYAEQGYDTINSRIESRFMDHTNGKHRGLLVVIGQTKSTSGFMQKTYDDFQKDPDALALRMKIWESHGWHKYTENPDDAKNMRETAPRKSFIYDVLRKEIIQKSEAVAEGWWKGSDDDKYIEVPIAYINPFIKNPQKALRDLAGIPPEAGDPFIALTHYITGGADLWTERMGVGAPVNDSSNAPVFADWFHATDKLKRVMHLDLAYSAEGDALGMAMGHVPEIVTTPEGEDQPLILFDFLMRIKAPAGNEIIFSDVRRLIYELKFVRGFNLKIVTMDGFQSTDFQQQLRKKKYQVEYLSVDKKKMPYEDLREAIYDKRCYFPPYMTKLDRGDTDLVNIAYRELSQLEDTGLKIDHPPKGSKDVADAMAGVCHYLMQDSQFRRGAKKARGADEGPSDEQTLEDYLALKSPNSLSPVSFDTFKGAMKRTGNLDEATSLSFNNFQNFPDPFADRNRLL